MMKIRTDKLVICAPKGYVIDSEALINGAIYLHKRRSGIKKITLESKSPIEGTYKRIQDAQLDEVYLDPYHRFRYYR